MPGWGEDKVRPQWWGLPQVPSYNIPHPIPPPPSPTAPPPSRPLSGAAHLHLVPSSAVDSHLQLWPLNHQSVWNIQLHFSLWLTLFDICSLLLCDWPMLVFGGLGEARRQNACLHCFLHLARFLNRVEQLTARCEVNRRSHVHTLCFANRAPLNPIFGVAQFSTKNATGAGWGSNP